MFADAPISSTGPETRSDITHFGGYIGSFTPPTISCDTTAEARTITCAEFSDFRVGQGIAVPAAGPAPVARTPNQPVAITSMSISGNLATVTTNSVSFTNGTNVNAAGMKDASLNGAYREVMMSGYGSFKAKFKHADCSPCSFGSGTFVAEIAAAVTPLDQTGGTSSICYVVSARDLFSAAISSGSAPFCTTIGFESLGVHSYTIAPNGCSTKNGLTTYQTTSPHHIPSQLGIEFNVVRGTTGTVQEEGAFTTVSATDTTVTMNQQSQSDGTFCPNGGELQVVARVKVQWTPQPGITLGHVVWRCFGAMRSTCANNSAYSLVALPAGTDSSFIDYGLAAPELDPIDAAYIPQHPPVSAINGILSTTIRGISGTTVTLAAPASISLKRATIFHDDVPSLIAACNSSNFGADVYIPAGGAAVFNSVFNEANCSAQWVNVTFASQIKVNEPIIPKSNFSFVGSPTGSAGANSSFSMRYQTFVLGGAYPVFLLSLNRALGGGSFSDLNISCAQVYQNCIYHDQDTGGNNVTTISYYNTSASGKVGSQPIKFGGGFGFNSYGGLWGLNGGATNWGVPPPILSATNAGFGQNTQEVISIATFDQPTYVGGEFLIESHGDQLAQNLGSITWKNPLIESPFYPMIRVNTPNNIPGGLNILFPSYADNVGGAGTPMIDLGNSHVQGVYVTGQAFNTCGSGPLFSADATQSARISAIGCSSLGLAKAVGVDGNGVYAKNNFIAADGTGSVFYAMQIPAAPSVKISGVTGPTAGTYFYRILANDFNGNSTLASPVSAGVAVNGTQGVLISWKTVPGQASTTICRGMSASGMVCASSGRAFRVSGTSYLDGPTIYPNQSLSYSTGAGSSSMGSAGLASFRFILPANGSVTSISGTSTANRVVTIPDASGPIALELFASLTTTSAKDDNVTLDGMTANGHCTGLTPTNSTAAMNIATTYISAKNTNRITISHAPVAGMTFDVACAPY
jgi:hypothetical protein